MTSSFPHRKLAAASLPLAAALVVAGALVDPGVDETSSTTYMHGLAQGGAADRYQVSALILHVAFLAFVPAFIGLWGLSRRGVARTAGLVLGVMGAATAAGLVVTDYYDIALARTLAPEQAARISDDAMQLAGAQVLRLTIVLGTGLGLVTLLITAVRARAIPAWTPAVVVAAIVVPAVIGSAAGFTAGAAVLLIGFGVVSARLLRRDPDAVAGPPATAAVPA